MSDYTVPNQSNNLYYQQCTIASGSSASEMIPTQGFGLVGLIMPSGWTAAAIGFKACVTGNQNDLVTVYNNASGLEQALVSTSRMITFPSPDVIFAPFIQLQSVTADSTTGVNQGAGRIIVLIFRKYLS